MSYGMVNKLFSEKYRRHDVVLIESPFEETTRMGNRLCSVLLALTPNLLVIASQYLHNEQTAKNEHSYIPCRNRMYKLSSLHPLNTVHLTVFKKTQRQSLKACFNNKYIRYFELGVFDKRKIFWKLWCNHVGELNSGSKLWPFVPPKINNKYPEQLWDKLDCVDLNSYNKETKRARWTDKYLYLGSRREVEDNQRPQPIPGLGRTEEIQLLYLKSAYFGCWEQSEHWVECREYGDESHLQRLHLYQGSNFAHDLYFDNDFVEVISSRMLINQDVLDNSSTFLLLHINRYLERC